MLRDRDRKLFERLMLYSAAGCLLSFFIWALNSVPPSRYEINEPRVVQGTVQGKKDVQDLVLIYPLISTPACDFFLKSEDKTATYSIHSRHCYSFQDGDKIKTRIAKNGQHVYETLNILEVNGKPSSRSLY
jgi:hypothetical protein